MLLSEKIRENVSLAPYSTFGIGGPARYFVEVTSQKEAEDAIKFAYQNNVPFIVIGKGSNCLFDDQGINGLVILNKIHFCEFQGSEVNVGSGFSFALLGVKSARVGLEGLEFASGIPASVGGAIFMNAGANGAETKDCIVEVTYLDEKGVAHTIAKQQMQFSYRHSIFHHMKAFIISAKFKLVPNTEAKKKQLQIVEYRTKTQPYGEKSAGCVFRNTLSSPAGALIDRCGLKGVKVGDAEVSSVHANFIVNKGTASAREVLELVSEVQRQVKEQTGEDLHMEIRYIPFHIG